jgi:CRISPR/Cas system CSM-associated protein Csm3 (group 7 of RAMP superfamily)
MVDQKPEIPYERACPACKLFGCTGTASRIGFADGELQRGYRSVVRDMIGIDRFTGGVHPGANMRFHALEGALFSTTVTVRNFELWQLGLLAYVFQDFADGIVSIGFGKSKGFGRVVGEVKTATLEYPAGRADGRLQHLGTLASEAERTRYGLHGAAAPECPLEAVPKRGLALYERFRVSDLESFWGSAAAAFNDFIAVRFAEEAA